MKTHPNATTATGSTAIAVLLVWLAGHFGIADLGAEEAIVLSGLITSVALFVGRRGLVGVWNVIKHGTSGK